ncbi:hypothetical protein HELRODRAFT_177766 [Helobdella robusta]|uniref:Uncharacterized protein n=1 Tax=Helobdella robusta TaxID=6412 RepID=T1FC79_HELRO|nr:hypothetical protein HELRODRAFT_177766 [Helobdella robusta]ESN97707.1 hypothetical protein HELRODRAFT_177766 [Helobdella robusta]
MCIRQDVNGEAFESASAEIPKFFIYLTSNLYIVISVVCAATFLAFVTAGKLFVCTYKKLFRQKITFQTDNQHLRAKKVFESTYEINFFFYRTIYREWHELCFMDPRKFSLLVFAVLLASYLPTKAIRSLFEICFCEENTVVRVGCFKKIEVVNRTDVVSRPSKCPDVCFEQMFKYSTYFKSKCQCAHDFAIRIQVKFKDCERSRGAYILYDG